MDQSTTSALEFLKNQRSSISSHLFQWISQEEKRYQSIIPEMHYSFQRIMHFCESGKMIRGALVLLLSRLHSDSFEKTWDSSTLHIAAAMELFQSFLLIHDDIMDRDPIRRGNPAVYMQYAQDMETIYKTNKTDSLRLGEALGICAGDITNFLGYEMISSATLSSDLKNRLFSVVNYELTRVGLAQMQDVAWSGTRIKIPTTDGVLDMYINKTGRYTFTLPMILGALLGGAEEKELQLLYELGDLLGILFQIRDDEIGIFGDPNVTGKPVGSDIQEGKKTIYISELFYRCSIVEQNQLLELLGNSQIQPHELQIVLDMMESKGVLEHIHGLKIEYRDKAKEKIDNLNEVNPQVCSLLHSLTDYCYLRNN